MDHAALTLWAEWMRAAGHTEKTIHTRLSQIQTLCRSVGETDPTQVTTTQMIHWLSECSASWTRRTYWASARSWCRWLVEQGYRTDNPALRLPTPKQPRSSPRPVPWAVIEKVLAHPPGLRSYAYTCLAAFAGLRCAEIAAVRGADLDHERGWFYTTGKGGQRLAVPLHPAIATLSIGMAGEGFWFPGSDHGHVRSKSVSNTLSHALRLAGSSSGTPHGIRHAYATRLLHNCHDSRVVQLLMRHASLSSTQIYVQVDDEDLVAAIHSLGSVA